MGDPIVLAHGFMGFGDNAFGIDYFRGVKKHFEDMGLEVYAPSVKGKGSIKRRAEELWEHHEKFIGDRPAHYIGHSMGGLDSRFLASPRGLDKGEHVTTLTTIGTPHHGTLLADIALHILPQTHMKRFISPRNYYKLHKNYEKYLNTLFSIGDAITKVDLDYVKEALGLDEEGVQNLTTKHMARMNDSRNVEYLSNHNSTYYASYAGVSSMRKLRSSTPVLFGPKLALYLLDGPNDGLVTVESQKWGDYQGLLQANHWEQMSSKVEFQGESLYTKIARDAKSKERP